MAVYRSDDDGSFTLADSSHGYDEPSSAVEEDSYDEEDEGK